MSEKTRGLYEKYEVARTDGTSDHGKKHFGCEYFVLDVNCDPFCVPALKAYAAACRAEYPQLADDVEAIIHGWEGLP